MAKRKYTSHKVQSNIEGYSLYVLKGLVDIHGKSVSDVVSFLVNDWIHENRDTLESYGLSVKDWKREAKELKS